MDSLPMYGIPEAITLFFAQILQTEGPEHTAIQIILGFPGPSVSRTRMKRFKNSLSIACYLSVLND